MKTILIDDNPSDLSHLEELCSKTPFITVVNAFTSALEAFSWLINNSVDLIISDVEMPDINGIEMIQQLQNKPMVIFVSAHPKYAMNSFSVEPVHYIEKPLKMESLLLAAHRAKDRVQSISSPTSYIFVLNNKEYVKIQLNELNYIEAAENYVQLYLPNKKLLILANLTQFTKQLPLNQFIRIHKSWTVNVEKIQKYSSEHVIVEGEIIPVGNAYKEQVTSILKGQSIQRKG